MLTIIKNIFILGSITLLVSSCATMNKDECRTANWKTIGYGDGANGYSSTRISQHRSACAEHGIAPNLNEYNAGRNQGLAQFCVPSTGYNKGLNGYSYNGVCNQHNEGAFLEAYNYGSAIHKEVQILKNLKSDYSREQRYIVDLERNLQFKEQQLVNGRLSKLKAYKILQETKKMAEELGKAKSNLGGLSSNINNQAARVEDMKRGRTYR